MVFWIAPVLGFLRSALPYALLFLRSIPDLIAPKPSPVSSGSDLPSGGQSEGVSYAVLFGAVYTDNSGAFEVQFTFNRPMRFVAFGQSYSDAEIRSAGGVTGTVKASFLTTQLQDGQVIVRYDGVLVLSFQSLTNVRILKILRADGLADTGGNAPPSNPINDDGLFNPSNPRIGDDNGNLNPAAIVLAPALPLVFVSAVLAGYSAAMAAAQAALSALDATRKIAEGLDALKTLWEKLKEFLDEWEKNRPSKRDIVRQTYGRILGDGALDFFPDNNTKFQAIQLDVVITNIPIGYGRYFGSLSPSRYRFRELGYIAFYSVNQGILSTHSIQFKRTSYQIPELAVGFIYHLGLDEQIKGFAFGTFSVEKT